MITKDEFKNLYAHKRIKIGSWSMVLHDDFKNNEQKCWDDLKSKLCNNSRFKNFKDEEHIIENIKTKFGKNIKYIMLGIKITCQYKNYKSYLAEARDKLQIEIDIINNKLDN